MAVVVVVVVVGQGGCKRYNSLPGDYSISSSLRMQPCKIWVTLPYHGNICKWCLYVCVYMHAYVSMYVCNFNFIYLFFHMWFELSCGSPSKHTFWWYSDHLSYNHEFYCRVFRVSCFRSYCTSSRSVCFGDGQEGIGIGSLWFSFRNPQQYRPCCRTGEAG